MEARSVLPLRPPTTKQMFRLQTFGKPAWISRATMQMFLHQDVPRLFTYRGKSQMAVLSGQKLIIIIPFPGLLLILE